ncbi:MAG: beta galactosidase jelly roll domain-containing protein [Bacteroidetes bacterium]|nr:beta galactosidase jelly roll domain-containing protein [Bacteroidota bacterium]
MKKIATLFFLLFSFYLSFADVQLPKIFGDNMVLQRDQSVPIWGWAEAGEKITVQFNQQKKEAKADKNGKWMVKLDAEPAGGPFQLIVSGKNTISFSNVLIGEVWICSGQSNMEFQVRSAMNAAKEIQSADYPQIRQIKIPNTVSSTPKNDISSGQWDLCSPNTVSNFTAVGYFFARELYNKLHVPIGLINTSWGGTMVETWTSRGAFEKSDEFKSMIASMPNLDLDALSKQNEKQMLDKLKTLQGGSFGDAVNTEEWKDINFDDSKWPKMKLPGLWEYQGLGLENLDGVVWFRKTVNVSDGNAGKPAKLDLGKIDDSDDTYVNGTKVGSTKNQYDANRHYEIPAGVLKAGKNIISVRVEDTGGGGGINGQPEDLQLTVGDKVYSLAGEWVFRVESIIKGSMSVGPNSYPTLLFNAMINPLVPYAIRGALWYQGEANAGRAYEYRQSFPLMINDWRQQWGQGNFPFYFVQLASWNANNGDSEHGSTWAELREAQTRTLSLPNTGMSVTTDIGESNDIHPKNKQDVGKRLAAIALNNVYGQTMEYSGPVYQSMKTESGKIILSFTHVGSGLMIKDKYGYIRGFEIAGKDQHFYYAKAYADGNRVVVYSDLVPEPVEVRFAWADDPNDANLFNNEGFPAVPFRTDQWKGITEGVKYAIK